VREAEDGAARIVGRYVPKTEGLRSWDIRGSNDRLNRVFELNCLPYGGYPGEDAAERRGKKPMGGTEKGPSQEAAPATKKRKLGTIVGRKGVSDNFAVELMGTCAAPGGRMSSPELRESLARMLEVTGGRWPKNLPIPWVEGEDMSTSCIARGLRIFPYGRNIAAVVSIVMNKDCQDAAQKRWAVIRLPDPRREAKRAWGSAKAAAPGGSQPTLGAKPAAPKSSKVSKSAKAVVAGGTKSTPGEAAKVRELPSPGKRVADFGTNISVVDYFVGKFFFDRWYVAGSGEGQMVVVPPAVATTASTAVVGVKGGSFYASGEISSAAAVKDEAGTMSRRLREASQQLSQQLSQVS
jgi:hypothetical protein